MIPLDSGLVAILRVKTEGEARDIAKALVASGVKLIEFTTTNPGAFDLIEEFAADKSLHVGLGTALTKEHVVAGKKAGAKFIISPHTDEEVIRATKAADLLSFPGVASATDVGHAIKYGADALKFFPASSLGLDYLKALREPFPGRIWMATGGINTATAGDWIKAGCAAVGLGGQLTSGGASEIPQRVKAFSEAIKAAKL